MRTILVEAPGLLTTVQDLGRPGHRAIGVSPSGAADAVSLRLGNRLVANPENAAALEITLIGGTLRFADGASAALAGSDFGATLDGNPINPNESFEARPGQALRLGPTRSGARCYLCVHGGVSVPLLLGSVSTHLLSGLGGLEGRALRKGDALAIGSATAPFRKRVLSVQAKNHLSFHGVLRVTPGPQADWFPKSVLQTFYSGVYRVGEQSDRMGLRLEGPALLLQDARPMLTEGVSLGAIQMPSGGLPIILFVDQQTTGGYPKIANVITVDLFHVGQLRPRDEVRFEQVTFEAARALLIEQEQWLTAPDSVLE